MARPNLYAETEVLDDAARANLPGRFVRLPDGVVHYELGGHELGQPVVLVHGFSVPYYIWDPTYEALAEAGLESEVKDSEAQPQEQAAPAATAGTEAEAEAQPPADARVDSAGRPFDEVAAAMAAAMDNASPPNVKEKNTSSISFMISFFPTTAEMGKPLAMLFPKAARSGLTPKSSWAPPIAYRNPVIISSRINRAPSS